MRLLLLSNSRQPDREYLDHAETAVRALFEDIREILFIPFALQDHGAYTRTVAARFQPFGIAVRPVAPDQTARRAVENAPGLFVGGGNTFRLLHRIQECGLIEPIRRRVAGGMPYMGSSAGTVIAAPTLMTTNDMPIVRPATFEALGLIPFQINPHYLDADPGSRHMGETREQRLAEFHEENDVPVVGLREGAWLRVEGPGSAPRSVRLEGLAGARLFRRGQATVEHAPGARLDGIL